MPLKKELLNLQWKQLRHDENYHKDIWLLTVHNRVNHMTLHFAKYSGQLAQANYENNTALFSKACLDSLIIATSLANILNVNLSTELKSYANQCDSIEGLSSILMKESNATIDSISRCITISVGKLAKAAESVDHLESFSFREVLSSLTIDIFKLALAGCFFINKDLSILKEIENRMLMVEKKSMFFEMLGNYKDGY